MESSAVTGQKERENLLKLAAEPLQQALSARGPRKVLVISPDETLLPIPQTGRRMHRIHINPAPGATPTGLYCAPDALPFLTDSFELVVALHLFNEGRGPVLAEIERVLIGGGFLLALGHARWSRANWSAKGLPGIRPFRLCRKLQEHSFRVEQCQGLGLAGAGVQTGGGWRTPLLGLSDLVLIKARYQETRPVIRRVQFGRPKARAGATAVEPLSRKAAS